MKGIKKFIIPALALVPGLALAQNLGGISTLTTSFGSLVNDALPILVGLALLGFFWGLVQFIFASGDPLKAAAGKTHMLWGIIALFVMVAIWGIIGFIGTNLGIQQDSSAGNISVPTVNNMQ
jgi:hypothetical protein